MADTTCQRECAAWIRENWLPARFGQTFTEQSVHLTTGGQYKFDAVSADGRVVASISTSRAATSSGKHGVGKMMKLRSDMLFHVLADTEHKLMVFTEACMLDACVREQENGRTPADIEFIRAELPPELSEKLAHARDASSREVRPS